MQSVWLIVLVLVALQFGFLIGFWQRRQRRRLTPILQLMDPDSGRLNLPLVGTPRLEGTLHRRQLRIDALERRGRPQLRIGLSSTASIFFTIQPRGAAKARGRIRRLPIVLQDPVLDEKFRFNCNSPERLRATFRRPQARDCLLALLLVPGLAQADSENGWLEANLLSNPQKDGWDLPRLRKLLERLHRLALALEGRG